MFRARRYITRSELATAIASLNDNLSGRIDQMEASQQGQIDAITAELGTVQTDLATAQSTLQSEIDSLRSGTPVNLAALQSVADALDPAVQKIAGLKPTPPAAA